MVLTKSELMTSLQSEVRILLQARGTSGPASMRQRQSRAE
jgi:hypothetical protein